MVFNLHTNKSTAWVIILWHQISGLIWSWCCVHFPVDFICKLKKIKSEIKTFNVIQTIVSQILLLYIQPSLRLPWLHTLVQTGITCIISGLTLIIECLTAFTCSTHLSAHVSCCGLALQIRPVGRDFTNRSVSVQFIHTTSKKRFWQHFSEQLLPSSVIASDGTSYAAVFITESVARWITSSRPVQTFTPRLLPLAVIVACGTGEPWTCRNTFHQW